MDKWKIYSKATTWWKAWGGITNQAWKIPSAADFSSLIRSQTLEKPATERRKSDLQAEYEPKSFVWCAECCKVYCVKVGN